MKRPTLIVAAPLIMVFGGLLLTGAKASNWMEGTWSGQGSQSNGSSWSIKLTVEPQGIGHYYYRIEYPSLGCSGYWTLKGPRPGGAGGTASFAEHIVDGRGKCVDNGTISVGSAGTFSGSVQTMAYHWSGQQRYGRQDNAGGTLNRWGVGSTPGGPNNGNLQGPNAGRFAPPPRPVGQ